MKKNFLSLVVAGVIALSMLADNTCVYAKEKVQAKKSKETYYLGGIKKGDLILWDVCSQCANTFSVTIKDDNKTYATIGKDDYITELNILSHESALYDGGRNLRIEVEFDNPSVEIKTAVASGSIKNEKKNTIGHLYNYSLEDGDDADYNDVSISITSWKKQG